MTQPLPVVVLDPGHGGTTKVAGSSANNATGPTGLLEKTVTLDIAQRAAPLLASDARVILTRTTDVNLGLAARAEVARSNDAAVFISIHLNGFADSSVDGTETWIAKSAGATSDSLAQAALGHLLRVTSVRDRGVRRSDLGVLLPSRHAPTTAACLAEVAFLTNPAQETLLKDPAYLDQIAEAIAHSARDSLAQASTLAYGMGVTDFLIDRLTRFFRDEVSQEIPLDPGAGGQSIGESALQMGDIIVSTTSHASSAVIRFGTGSQVSHAKLYIGAGQVIEAIGSGITMRSLEDSLADDTVAVAFRYPGITTEQQLRVRDFAGRQLDLPYNYLGVVRLAAFQVAQTNCDRLPEVLQGTCRNWIGRVVLGPGNSDTYFCSEMVLAAFADAGIPLTTSVPHWNSPQEIVELSITNRLGYVGHLKAPPAGSMSLAWGQKGGFASDGNDRRAVAAAIGGYGAPDRHKFGSAFDAVGLGFGVAGGTITDGFYRDATEKQAITGRSAGRSRHLGIDVSTSNGHGGGADDARRGLPVYAVVRRTIEVSELNSVRARNGESQSGVGVDGSGTAELQNAIVLAQPWGTQDDSAYGGVVGLACRYNYPKNDGTTGKFTLYIEYLHLITPTYLPKDGNGNVIAADVWAATGKPIGFGPRITNGAQLTADDLTAGDPILVGYLGATQFPHVHIQAAYGPGEQRYMRLPRIDPAVMLHETSSTSQALAAGVPSLALGAAGIVFDADQAAAAAERLVGAGGWATPSHR